VCAGLLEIAMHSRIPLAGLIVCSVVILRAMPADTAQAGRAASAGDCVAIGTPRPGATYHYTRSQSNGTTTENSQQWESVTPAGSRLKTTGPGGTQIQVNEHEIVDNVAVLKRTSRQSAAGAVIETATFAPGIPSAPAFRACAGKSWTIPPATATFQSGQRTGTATSPAGTLKIVNIRERITVPAGTFDVVHYIRTSQSVDEYWKSTQHGVVVKHVATLSGVTFTETLIAIK
jgi:hypothetical protein